MSSTTQLQVFPGATWTASDGKHIQAHGGGVLKVGSKYYWHGEDKTDGTHFQNINCYSSDDLVQWHFEGSCLSRQTEHPELGPERLVERPKVIENKRTGLFVMYVHIESPDYSDAKVGVATCDSVNGRFTYQGSFRPLGHESRDIGVFVDDDESAYLLSEDRSLGLHIFELSSDYQSVIRIVHTFKHGLESPAMMKRNGLYYLFASHLTFWYANDNVYTTAPSLTGPWKPWKEFAPVGSKTHDSQVTFVLPLGPSVLYLGDRWEYPGLPRSTYLWQPLHVDGADVTMNTMDTFTLDAKTARVTADISLKPVQPMEIGTVSEKDLLAEFCFTTSTAVEALTVALRYTTSLDREVRGAMVLDDHSATHPVAFLYTREPGMIAISSVQISGSLNAGEHRLRVTAMDKAGKSGLALIEAILPNI